MRTNRRKHVQIMDTALNDAQQSENVALDPSTSNSKSLSEPGQDTVRRNRAGTISRRLTRAGTAWEYSDEDLDLLRHFLIISVTEADLHGCTGCSMNGTFNPYCTVEFDCMLSKQHQSIKTRKIYDSDGNPKWNFVKRFSFSQLDHLPQTINFTVWDYDEGGDAEFGSCSFTHPSHDTTAAGDHKWHCSHSETLPLSNSKGTLKFGIYYKCCSLNDLAKSMDTATRGCVLDSFDHVAADWYGIVDL